VASHTATTTLTLPAGTPPGRYFVIAEANGAGATPEASSTNNTRAASLKIGPDLAIDAVNVPCPDARRHDPGSYTIINFGGGSAALLP
jgi:hypothetical protein